MPGIERWEKIAVERAKSPYRNVVGVLLGLGGQMWWNLRTAGAVEVCLSRGRAGDEMVSPVY